MSAIILLTTTGAALGLLGVPLLRRGEGDATQQRRLQLIPIPIDVEHERHAHLR